MYDRFTETARKVMQIANEQAQKRNHEYIGTEHVLLGIVLEQTEQDDAQRVLRELKIDWKNIVDEINKLVITGPEMVTMGKLPQTPRAKKVIEYAIDEANRRHRRPICSEDILVGLLLEFEGVAAQVLTRLGVTVAKIRALVPQADAKPTEPTPALAVKEKEDVLDPMVISEITDKHLVLHPAEGCVITEEQWIAEVTKLIKSMKPASITFLAE